MARDLLAITPIAGDPAVFDAATALGQRLVTNLAATYALVFPGVASLDERTVDLQEDLFRAYLTRRPPEFPQFGVYLTGHAAAALEGRLGLTASITYQSPTGVPVPLFRLETVRNGGIPARIRNQTLLGRDGAVIPRPDLSGQLRDQLKQSAVLRACGEPGVGKTHLVWHALSAGHEVLWGNAAKVGRGRSLAANLLSQLPGSHAGEEPRIENYAEDTEAHRLRLLIASLRLRLEEWMASGAAQSKLLVCDDLERANLEELELLADLAAPLTPESPTAIVLVARSGTIWPQRLAFTPEITVPPLSAEEASLLEKELCSGPSVSAPVRKRFQEATAGNPFAFEEGLLQLIRRGLIRRIYGSFFYAGDDQGEYQASPRLVRHLFSEVARLGHPLPLLALAATDLAVPQDALSEAVQPRDSDLPADWWLPYRNAGWTREVPSPWGVAISFRYPAFGEGLRQLLAHDEQQGLRHAVGRVVGRLSADADARWQAYRLLRGSHEAAIALLDAHRRPPPGVTREQVAEALATEVRAHQERQGDRDTELELIWALLPHARRLGALRTYRTELERALEIADSDERRISLAALKADLDQDEGRSGEATGTLRLGLDLAVKTNSRKRSVLVLQLIRTLIRQERYDEAERLAGLVMSALDRESPALAASCRFYMGNVSLHCERFEEAVDLHQRALEERRRQNLVSAIGPSLTALANVRRHMGDYPRALEGFQAALVHLEEHAREEEVSFALIGLGTVLERLGQPIEASRHLRRALELREGRDDTKGEAIARLAVADNYLRIGLLDKASEHAIKARFSLSLLDRPTHLADAEGVLGRIDLARRRPQGARQHLEEALRLHLEHQDRRAVAADLADLLELALQEQREEEVVRLCQWLDEELSVPPSPERRELLELRLFNGLEWLERQVPGVGSAVSYLERSFRELMRKTAYLAPEHRSEFLYAIQDHQDILRHADRHRITL